MKVKIIIPIVLLFVFSFGVSATQYNFTTGLVSYWTLDANSATILDNSTGGHNLTKVGSPTYTASGKIGGAYTFDAGESNVFSVGGSYSWSEVTYAFWIKSTDNSIPDNAGIFIPSGGYGPTTQETGKIRFNNAASTSKIDTMQWIFVVIQRCGSRDLIYINNTLQSNVSSANALATTGFYMGSDLGGVNNRGIDSTIDEFGIWDDRCLNSSEMTELYNSGNGLSYINFTNEVPVINNYTLIGNVSYNNSLRVGVNVSLLNGSDSSVLSRTITNSSGQYLFSDLTNNSTQYIVLAYNKTGIHTASGYVNISGSSNVKNLDFYSSGTTTSNTYYLGCGCITYSSATLVSLLNNGCYQVSVLS